MDARMGNVRLKVQIDFGVGDVMVPGSRMIDYPVFLSGDTIQLLAYPVESAIAEKLQAMVALGGANSRMKDFYDVWICSRHLDFDTATLLKAIEATFKNRETPIPEEELEAFTPAFASAHRLQWNAFAKKMGESELADRLANVIQDLTNFARPMFRAISRREKLPRHWKVGRGWADS